MTAGIGVDADLSGKVAVKTMLKVAVCSGRGGPKKSEGWAVTWRFSEPTEGSTNQFAQGATRAVATLADVGGGAPSRPDAKGIAHLFHRSVAWICGRRRMPLKSAKPAASQRGKAPTGDMLIRLENPTTQGMTPYLCQTLSLWLLSLLGGGGC